MKINSAPSGAFLIEVRKLPEVFQQTSQLEMIQQRRGVGKYRRWFRDAVDYWRKWQDEAREDYDFVEGRQWTKAELMRFKETMRPAITICPKKRAFRFPHFQDDGTKANAVRNYCVHRVRICL